MAAFPGSTPAAAGDGVNGVLKGCAADVEVAAVGLCEAEGGPWRGADCVAAAGEMAFVWRGAEVEKERTAAGAMVSGATCAMRVRAAARKQRLQIIVVRERNWSMGVKELC